MELGQKGQEISTLANILDRPTIRPKVAPLGPPLVLWWADLKYTLLNRFCMPQYAFCSIVMELGQTRSEISSLAHLWGRYWSYGGPI